MSDAPLKGYDSLRMLLDDDGNPPCDTRDGCPVCVLFDRQPPGESRAEWLARITGYPEHHDVLEAS